jgi:small redox-active disulfide protein 2
MNISVLGPGCANCKALEARTRDALEVLGVDATIDKISDFAEIVGYGVMSTPALVVDEEVVVSGRMPSVDELCRILTRPAA